MEYQFTEPRTEKEFDEWMKKRIKEDDEFGKFFREHPEKIEMYKRKWFDSLGDRD